MAMTATYPATYPPGVLTGRPMEMFEVSLFSGPAGYLDLYAVPEQWSVGDKDMEILQELCDALDQRHDEEMNWIEQQLVLLERYQDQTDYYMYPMIHEDGGVLSLTDFSDFGIKEALQQFEEDFDYEQSLWAENKACEEQQINLHRLLACEDLTKRPGWSALCTFRALLEHGSMGQTTKERYTWDVEMITSFPENKKGYALGKTPYGLVFFPEKFRHYHPGVGGVVKTTVALRDATEVAQGRRSFPFTAVYLH